MPVRDDLLNPIPGDNPSGANLRYDPAYDKVKVKEARRVETTLRRATGSASARSPITRR
jgi:hypothetical protein